MRCFTRRAFVAAVALCLTIPASIRAQEATPAAEGVVILATTTSTADTGLLDVLAPLFLEKTGLTLKPIAVGSGAALEMGEKGEADVLLVHSPAAEETFMADGLGIERRTVMYNDFVIVGPADDPAKIADAEDAIAAMAAIAEAGAPFVSRGDDSGTHNLEKKLWKAAEITPEGPWYVESGSGMADTLRIANEQQAYTISDRGTWLAQGESVDFPVLFEGGKALQNIYHVILLNPENGDRINSEGGAAFMEFLMDPETQQVIAEFGVDEFDQPLFTPCADDACFTPATQEATPAG